MVLFRLMDTEAVIINEVVINNVRSRECLWNPRNVHYKNKTVKYKAWEEVSVAVLPKYTTCSEDDKRRIVRAVQSRWKTARDAYMKCRLTEGKQPIYKARQQRYIYNKLSFLEQIKDIFGDVDEGVNTRLDDEEGSTGFVGDKSASQSTSTVCDDDDDDVSEGTDEIMDFDIDIHDDFKENITNLGIGINDDTEQECLPGTSSQNNNQKDSMANADVTKPTSANTSVLQTDDQLFFNSLAPLINNLDIHQKLKLRSKILEVVMEAGNTGPKNIKQ